MADPNQKLFSQIADLGRNINSLAESIKKNTSATESLVSATDKSVKSEKESATASNKASTTNATDTNKGGEAIKDLTKILSGLLGEKGPLMGKIAEMAKSKILPASGPGKQLIEQPKDFSNIAGGLKGIIKAFQEGGVAKKEGKYLVGENGPEVVKLPKGAGVIPINVKDLIEGLKTVPELANIIKDKDSVDFYGSISNSSVIDSKGKVISLNRLSADYENKGDNAKDSETANRMSNAQGIIDSLIDLGRNNITNEVNKIDGETMDLATKSKLNYEKRDQLVDDILREVDKNGDYYNTLAISKAALLATKTILDKEKEGEKGTGAKAEESLSGLPDNLVKESEADLKKEAADLKKSQSVVGAKDDKKEAADLKKSQSVVGAKDDKKEKGGLFSKFKKNKDNEENARREKNESALLSKVGAGAENALFSAAGNAAESLGIASPLAKKGLNALKGAIDKKGGLVNLFSKKSEFKTELEKKSTIPPNANPALVNDVKKLTPVAKKEAAKTQEASKEIRSEESKATPTSAPTSDTKKDNDKKSEASEPNKSGLGSDKDIQDIKNALTRMAGLLEGTLTVSLLDQPFRPDSRNF
jgi:hypothetical protein